MNAAPAQRSTSLVLLALFFVAAGVMHFIVPRAYERIVPLWIPNASLAVILSGIAESLGGAGLLLAATRRMAAWGLIVLLIAVFPANVYMLRMAHANHASIAWQAALWLRLPLQGILIWWVWNAALRDRR